MAQTSVITEPWGWLTKPLSEEPSGSSTVAAGLGPLVLCPERLANAAARRRDRLTAHGPTFRPDGTKEAWRAFDLSAADRGRQEELRLPGEGPPCSVVLTEQVPRPGRRSAVEDKACTDQSEALATFINAAVGTLLELRSAAEYVAGRTGLDEATRGDLALVPTNEFERAGSLLLARLPWAAAAHVLLKPRREPRMDVIVGIALDFQEDLVHLATSPRRILRRERQRTPVGRVQQMDSACLAWLVRQPGRTAVEKAGPTQQILAVVRAEDYDTLENRVLKDFVARCIAAADLYVREHRSRFEASARYKAVAALRDTCRRLMRETPLVHVRSLPAIPQPNYVLLHAPAYRELWSWYLKLVRRQQVNDEAWRWQRRLWADFVRLRVAAQLIQPFEEDEFTARTPFAHDLWVREEQDAGCWLLPADWPGPVILRGGQGAEIVAQCAHPLAFDGDELCCGLPVSRWLGLTGADLAVVFSPLDRAVNGQVVCLFVWAIQSAAEDPQDKRVIGQTARACKALRGLLDSEGRQGVTFRGIILRSHLQRDVLDLPSASCGQQVEVYGACVPADPRAWHEKEGVFGLRYCLYDCLTHVHRGG